MKSSIATKSIMKEYIGELKKCLDALDLDKVEGLVDILEDAFKRKKTIFILGNGGSASNASHMACDLGKGTLLKVYDETEPRFRVISLTDNAALMTAFANDLSYEDVFIQQLRNLVSPGDLVIVLSASGKSKNIIKAVQYAKKCKAVTIGLLGFTDGGALAHLVDHALIISSNRYGICEDLHLVLNHLITTCVAKRNHNHKKRSNKHYPQ